MRSTPRRVAGIALAALVWIAFAALALSLPTPAAQIVGAALIVLAGYTLIWAAESQGAVRAARLEREQTREIEQLRDEAAAGARRETALVHAKDGVLIVQENGHVEFVNPAARAFLQDRVLEVTSRLNHPDLERIIDEARSTGAVVSEDITLWVPGARPAQIRALPLADGATVLLLSDLSESYRLDRVRRDFVANVSHELKTPVAGIRALAETAATALASSDTDTAIRFVERLGSESARLADLVTDLLDLSRVETGEMHRTNVHLDALLVEAAERGRVVGEAKDIEVVVHPSGLEIDADPSQLTMAVKNLVDNAVRYSEGGKVELTAETNGDLVVITVADQGLGIPSDELNRVFERFYRVDKGRSRATGGTGLGLAIVRHVVENHGGRVSVDSELGAGSTFTITLPRGAV